MNCLLWLTRVFCRTDDADDGAAVDPVALKSLTDMSFAAPNAKYALQQTVTVCVVVGLCVRARESSHRARVSLCVCACVRVCACMRIVRVCACVHMCRITM